MVEVSKGGFERGQVSRNEVLNRKGGTGPQGCTAPGVHHCTVCIADLGLLQSVTCLHAVFTMTHVAAMQTHIRVPHPLTTTTTPLTPHSNRRPPSGQLLQPQCHGRVHALPMALRWPHLVRHPRRHKRHQHRRRQGHLQVGVHKALTSGRGLGLSGQRSLELVDG